MTCNESAIKPALIDVVAKMTPCPKYDNLKTALNNLAGLLPDATTSNMLSSALSASATLNMQPLAPALASAASAATTQNVNADLASTQNVNAAPAATQNVNAASAPPKQIPDFKQKDSNITFNTYNGTVKTNYFQIMKKIDKFLGSIDTKISKAVDEEDKQTFTERKQKYENVKTLLENATTEDEVEKIITTNEVKFDSGNIVSGGTRKRKTTQRKRAKTLKNKKKVGKRK